MLSKKFIFALTALLVMLVGVQQPVFAAKKKHAKEKRIVAQRGERKVLYAEGADGDDKLVAARQNYKIAMEMLKKAIEMGHVVQDKNGMYQKKCGDECSCLPVVPSAVKKTK